MKPSEIISMARKQSSNTGTGLVTQDDAFVFLNIILTDFWTDVCNESPGYAMTTYTTNLVSGTKDYTFPTPVAAATLLTSSFGLQQLTKIGVKFSASDTAYTPVSVKFIEGLLNLPEYYATQGSKASPMAVMTNTTITLFPTPIDTITNGLQMVYPQSHFQLSTATEDVEGVILIPANYHMVLVEGIKYLMYGARGQDFDQSKQQQKQYYDSEKLRTINQMIDRNQLADETFMPDLSIYG